MKNCNSSKKSTNGTTAVACNEAGNSILKSITKGDNVKTSKALINGQWHRVLATVSIDTSQMENPTKLIILSGYIFSSYKNETGTTTTDRPMLVLFKKSGCPCDKKKCDTSEDGYEELADYTIPFDYFDDTRYRVEHVFAHHYTDAEGNNTCVSTVCSQENAGIATYVLAFRNAEEEGNKIDPTFEDVHLSALAVENKLD